MLCSFCSFYSFSQFLARGLWFFSVFGSWYFDQINFWVVVARGRWVGRGGLYDVFMSDRQIIHRFLKEY